MRIPGAPDDLQPTKSSDEEEDDGGEKTAAETYGSVSRRREDPTGNDDSGGTDDRVMSKDGLTTTEGASTGSTSTGDTTTADGDSASDRSTSSSSSSGSNSSSSSSSGSSTTPNSRPSPDKMREVIGGDGDSLPEGEQGVETGDDKVAEQARQLEQQVTDNDPFVSEEGVQVERDGDRLVARLNERGREGERQRAETRARTEVMEKTGITNPENITVESEDGQISARPSDEWIDLERAEAEQEQEERQRLQRGMELRNDIRNRVQAIKPQADEEQFGDFSIQNPLTGNRVEEDLEGVSDGVRNTARGLGNVVGNGQAFMRNTAAAAVGEEEFRGNEILENPTESPTQANDNALAGTVEGAASLVGAPVDVALAAKEGVELAGYTGQQVRDDFSVSLDEGVQFSGEATGKEADELADAGTNAVDSFISSAQDNPGRTGGLVVGSLVGSVGVMGGAARVSSRAGRASRYAIQPGEEIASEGLSRAFPSVASKFPNNKIDNEEIVINKVLQGEQKAISAGRRAKAGLSDSFSDFADANRAQADLSFGLETDSEASEPIEIADDPMGSSPDRGIDPAQQELDQVQYELDTFAGQERTVTRDQFRDFERGAQEQSVTRQERQRQDALDQLTFDPDAESNVEPALNRQRQAERTFDELGDRGFDWSQFDRDTAVEAELDRRADAESPETFQDTELSQELQQRQRAAEAMFGQQQEQGPSTRQEQFEFPQFDQEPGFNIETETGQELGQEFGQEFELETEQETEQNQELNQGIESMFESEAEAEAEFEFGTESEFEIEGEGERGSRSQSRSGGMFGEVSESQFERDVGDPVDFVLGDLGGGSKSKKKKDDDLGLDFGGLFGV